MRRSGQAEHLTHWGINMMALQKTEKTMAELQIDLNMSFEFDRITEAGAALQPLSGPGCGLPPVACILRVDGGAFETQPARCSVIRTSEVEKWGVMHHFHFTSGECCGAVLPPLLRRKVGKVTL